jgi:hypothetical protein
MWGYLKTFFDPASWGDLLVILWPLLAIVVGFFLIGMMRKNPPAPAEAEPGAPRSDSLELARLKRLSPENLIEALRELLESLKLEVDPAAAPGVGGVFHLAATNPAPLTGGRILIELAPAQEAGAVDAPPVVALLDNVRAEQALKGIYVALYGFTTEARAAAASTQVELLDGEALVKLLKKHCPRWLVEQ